MRTNIEINIEDIRWQDFIDSLGNEMEKAAQEVIIKHQSLAKIAEIEVSLLLTENKKITLLNKEFRSKDKPTNVLSFPEYDLDELNTLEFKLQNDYIYIGDIAMSFDIIKDEAFQQNITFKNHFIHLFVHSLLHLLGYDHETDDEASLMEKLEIEILAKLGIESPY